MSVLDFNIPFSMSFVIAGAIEILATIAITASVTWQVLIVAILAMLGTNYVQVDPNCVLYIFICLVFLLQRSFKSLLYFGFEWKGYYLASARELIRINGTTKAPVMNYAAETSLGVVTIRAFDMMNRFFQNYLKLIDTDATLSFHSNAAMEWLVMRVEGLQNLTLFAAALLLVLLPQGAIAPGICDHHVYLILSLGMFSI